jgi:hypothetical protein
VVRPTSHTHPRDADNATIIFRCLTDAEAVVFGPDGIAGRLRKELRMLIRELPPFQYRGSYICD